MTVPRIQVQDLCVGHGGVAVLEHIHLTVEPGCWMALLGPNASGKTTLLKTLAGHLRPLQGSIHIDGERLDPATTQAGVLPGFALAPDELPAFLTIRQCLDVHAEAWDLGSVPAGIEDLARDLGLLEHAHVLTRRASLGTRQKLAVLIALMRRPRVLLLDEVFNGLDFASAATLRNWLRGQVDQGMSVLLATHALDVVFRCCDEAVLLDPPRGLHRWCMRDFAGEGGLAAFEEALASASPVDRRSAAAPGNSPK